MITRRQSFRNTALLRCLPEDDEARFELTTISASALHSHKAMPHKVDGRRRQKDIMRTRSLRCHAYISP